MILLITRTSFPSKQGIDTAFYIYKMDIITESFLSKGRDLNDSLSTAKPLADREDYYEDQRNDDG